jgi:hypothetical protein
MKRAAARWLTLSAVLALAGCANLVAKKVPIADRLSGTDDKVHGFRYYLSRPYVVVSQRVCVGLDLAVGRLLVDRNSSMVYVETTDPDGRPRCLDGRGVEVPRPADCEYAFLPKKSTEQGGQSGKPGMGSDPKGMDADEKPAGDPSRPPQPVQVIVVAPGARGRTLGEVAGSAGDLAAQLARGGAGDPTFSIQGLSQADIKAYVGSITCPTPNSFQFVMLPDFEEQMAIKDCNFAAYSKYQLQFADGWQLRSVSGTWDATEVAIKALQVLSNAVSAAAEVRAEELTKLPVGRAGDVYGARGGIPLWGVIVHATYLEPGIYRLQKASERSKDGGCATEADALGLLSELGIPTVSEVQLYVVK